MTYPRRKALPEWGFGGVWGPEPDCDPDPKCDNCGGWLNSDGDCESCPDIEIEIDWTERRAQGC